MRIVTCHSLYGKHVTTPISQVQFKITEEHDEIVQIVLAQQDTRIDKDKENLTIGYMIFKVKDDNTERVDSVMDILEIPAGTNFINSRQLYNKFELGVGTLSLIHI